MTSCKQRKWFLFEHLEEIALGLSINFYHLSEKNYIQISGYGCSSCTEMEVIDLNCGRKTRLCQGSNSKYPKAYGTYGTATFTDGIILACGDYHSTEQCYIYKKNQGWSELSKMSQKRGRSASIPIDGGMIVTGGKYSETLKSSEIVFTNGSVIKGQNLILDCKIQQLKQTK